jgi:RNA polymerase sigma factor (sigma-70 family)
LVVAGNAAARTALIDENMVLVVLKADSLIKQVPSISYLRDDLISAGYIGLVIAVNKVAQGRMTNARGLNCYLGRCVRREMLELLPHERPIHVPKRSSAVARNPASVSWNVQPIEIPVVVNTLPDGLQTDSPTAAVELRDIFAVCCKSDRERECLRLREEGYTFVEIGEHLGIGKSLAQRIFTRLRARIYSHLEKP